MPFDGLNISTLSSARSLQTSLRNLDIEPVPKTVLDRHKAAEIANHPASLFWQRENLYLVSCLFGFLLTVSLFLTVSIEWIMVCFGGPLATPLEYTVALLISTALTIKTAFSGMVRGPARWKDTHISPAWGLQIGIVPRELKSAPEPIFLLARYIAQNLPQASFVVGTLYQEQVELDPYLLVQQTDAQGKLHSECLAIWDGDCIIHLASLPM